jgi:hypothetical protein
MSLAKVTFTFVKEAAKPQEDEVVEGNIQMLAI